MPLIETARLVLRELQDDDLDFLHSLLSDAAVMRFYPRQLSREEAREWLVRQQERYARDGFGLWLVRRRDDAVPVGQVGILLQDVDERRVPEIGYMIASEHWRRGYASEAAIACRDHAFAQLGCSRVVSLIRPENKPSQGVAVKLGMTPQRRTMWRGFEHVVYSVARR